MVSEIHSLQALLGRDQAAVIQNFEVDYVAYKTTRGEVELRPSWSNINDLSWYKVRVNQHSKTFWALNIISNSQQIFSTLIWPTIALSRFFNLIVDTHEYFVLPEGTILLPTDNTGQKPKHVFYDLLISNSFQPTHEEGGCETVLCLELWRKARSDNNYTQRMQMNIKQWDTVVLSADFDNWRSGLGLWSL